MSRFAPELAVASKKNSVILEKQGYCIIDLTSPESTRAGSGVTYTMKQHLYFGDPYGASWLFNQKLAKVDFNKWYTSVSGVALKTGNMNISINQESPIFVKNI